MLIIPLVSELTEDNRASLVKSMIFKGFLHFKLITKLKPLMVFLFLCAKPCELYMQSYSVREKNTISLKGTKGPECWLPIARVDF